MASATTPKPVPRDPTMMRSSGGTSLLSNHVHRTTAPGPPPHREPTRTPLGTAERVLIALELFLALGAFAGGANMLAHPSGHANGLTAALLVGTPFHSYVVPAITLIVLNGLFPIAVAILALRRRRIARMGHLAVPVVLACWLAGEVYVVGWVSWMQPAFFTYAVVLAALGGYVYRRFTPSG